MTFFSPQLFQRQARGRLHPSLIGAVLGILTSLSFPAVAGNLDAFYLSGSAALEGGAVTATSVGGGAIWYNPAGLAKLEGSRLDVSLNGYAVRFGGQAELSAASSDASVERLSRLDLNVVPSGLTLTHRFGRFGVGLGVFVPTQGTTVLRTLIREPDGLVLSTDLYERLQEYHVGPSVGWSLNEKWDFGASMLINYRTSLSMGTVTASGEVSDAKFQVMTHNLEDWVQIGAEFVVGTQWKPSEDWSLGVNVRTPAIRLMQIVQTMDSTTASAFNGDVGTSTVENTAKDDFGLSAAVLTPFRFHLGAARKIGRYRVSMDGSVLLPFIDEQLNVNGRSTWNARVGVKKDLNERFSIGGGLYTDLSTDATPTEFGQSQINFYGLTIAGEMRTRYEVLAKDGAAVAKPSPMLFGTTVALSYALGVGSVMSSAIALDPSEGLRISNLLTDVVAHEITLYIGSTFAE